MNGSEQQELPPELRQEFAAMRARRAPPALWTRIERQARLRRGRRFVFALAAGLLLWGLLAFALRQDPAAADPDARLGGPFGLLAVAIRDDVHRPTTVERSPELRLLEEIRRLEVK